MLVPTASEEPPRAVGIHGVLRIRAALATGGAAVLGAAPHVLHHVGPLAGAALVAGATGTLLFGAVGFVLAVPMLVRLYRRHGWPVPTGILVMMATAFAISTLVIGPALSGGDEAPSNPASAPAGVSPSEHDSHHP
ncbi:MAG: hypothetical protein AB7I08_07775 [Thermoleophilia bacterium]